ncbi:MAG: NAD-dependent epimerase/dehydratase family protein [Pseudomonadota bacterium]|nr:NAD-dependent epimerase/dehydratase family protein [Pseudomonadota bacterium]
MKVAVLGATGFVGGALADALDLASQVELIRLQRPYFDLTQPNTWKLPGGVDTVVVAAGISSGPAEDLWQTNVMGPARFAEYCRKVGVGRLILLSSGAVYGNTLHETTPLTKTNPTSDYGKSKLEGEIAVRAAWGDEKLAILRLYFPYGPGQKTPRLIPRIIERIENQKAVVCRSDGGPRITLTHISDLKDILVNDFILRERSGIYNLASNSSLSIQSIVEYLVLALQGEARLDHSGEATDVVSEPYDYCRDWRSFEDTVMQWLNPLGVGNGLLKVCARVQT